MDPPPNPTLEYKIAVIKNDIDNPSISGERSKKSKFFKINKKKKVLVTGGTGFIAGWIIKHLVAEGVTVHATVRDPDDKQKVAHLVKLSENNPGEIILFKADLLEPGSFNAAAKGCNIVFHTASPFLFKFND